MDIDTAVAAQRGPLRNRYGHITLHGGRRNSILPELHMLLGNHEQRFSVPLTWTTSCSEGIISMEDLEYEKFGWSVYRFFDRIDIDGIVYPLASLSGVAWQRRLVGENPATPSILNKRHMSLF